MSAEDRIELPTVPVWGKPSSEGSIIVRRLIFPLMVLLFSRSLIGGFDGNGIGDEGAAAIGKALEVNTTVTTLK